MGKLEESLPLVTAANPAWVFSQIRERDWYLPALKYGVPALSPPLSPAVAQFMPSLHTGSRLSSFARTRHASQRSIKRSQTNR